MTLSHYCRRHVYNEHMTLTVTAPTDYSYGAFCINGDDWDGLNDVIFEAIIAGTGSGCMINGRPGLNAQLYNLTDSVNVGSEVSFTPYAVGVARTSAIGVTSFASGNKWYIIKLLPICNANQVVRSLDIMFGVSTTATKFCKYIELGTNYTVTGSTYTEGSTYGPKRCTWGGDTAYGSRSLSFEATAKASATKTTSVKLYDAFDLADLSVLETSNTSYEGIIADGISEPRSEDSELRVLMKSTTLIGIAYLKMATLVIKQTGSPTITREHITITSAAQNQDTSTSYVRILDYSKGPTGTDYPQIMFGNFYFGGVAYCKSTGTHYARLSDADTGISDSEVSTTSTTPVHMKSSPFSSPFNPVSFYTTQYKYATNIGTEYHDYMEFDETVSYPSVSNPPPLMMMGVGK